MPKKVLVVDDEPNIVAALEYLLQRSGYEVRTASDGEEALHQIEAFTPDLVLLDVMMPRRSGYDVCQRIREHPDWAGIKVLMVSAKGSEPEVSKGLSIGADGYITKPFANADLMAQIRKLLGDAPSTGGA